MTCYHNTLYYHDADYDRFNAQPGGDRVLGLEAWHHYDFTPIRPLPGETTDAAAYRHVRETHHFLTDDNHTWEIVHAEKPWWASRVRVIKNKQSPLFVLKPSWVDDGPGAHWFSQEFRVATVGMIEAEIEADRLTAERYEAEAAAQRDSIRGRKRASLCRSMAHSARWRGAVAPFKRWPELSRTQQLVAA